MILLDTSGLFSAMFTNQRLHQSCRRALLSAESPLLLSPFVFAELDYLVTTTAGVDAELALLQEVARGAYDLVDFTAEDVARAHEIAAHHRDLEVGLDRKPPMNPLGAAVRPSVVIDDQIGVADELQSARSESPTPAECPRRADVSAGRWRGRRRRPRPSRRGPGHPGPRAGRAGLRPGR